MAPTHRRTPAPAGAALAFAPATAEAWQQIMQESVRFLTRRLEKDFAAQQSFLTCKSPLDVVRLQTEFCQTALEDYSEEATRMVEILAAANGAATARPRDRDDVPV